MNVTVIGFATAGDVLGGVEITVELADDSRLRDLEKALIDRFPSLAELWPRLAVAVDDELVRGDIALADGASVALLPPVSGGAPPYTALIDGPIDVTAVERAVADPRCGARLLFLGTVRDHHAGRRVERLEYSAHRVLAEKALQRIAAELETGGESPEDEPLRVAIVHRLGEVAVGEASVAIAVASPHRDAAYQISRLALERLKREVPIWKREHYADGSAVWREEEPLG